MPDMEGRLLLIADNTKTARKVEEMFKRLRNVLQVYGEYSDFVAELDEDDPDLMHKMAAPIEKMTIGMVTAYPHGHRQMLADLETIRSLTNKIQVGKPNPRNN